MLSGKHVTPQRFTRPETAIKSAKKTTKTKVVASKFVVYSDSVRRNPAVIEV